MEWRPIDSAPRDGTWLLVTGGMVEDDHACGDCSPAVAVRWDTVGMYGVGGEWMVTPYDSNCASIRYEGPTHWMPLPEPPKAS